MGVGVARYQRLHRDVTEAIQRYDRCLDQRLHAAAYGGGHAPPGQGYAQAVGVALGDDGWVFHVCLCVCVSMVWPVGRVLRAKARAKDTRKPIRRKR